MVVIFIKAIRELHVTLKKENLYKIMFTALISLIVCSLAFYYFEHTEENGLTVVDALWWGFVTCTTVGYGDYFPVTLGGRLIAMILMGIGIGAFGLVTAAIASIFIENRLKRGMGLMDITCENHIIIIGWNSKSNIILDEIIHDNSDTNVVILDTIENLELDHKNAFFVHGDPSEDTALEKANVKKARTVIVTADEKLGNNDTMADSKSVLICLAVDKLNPNTHLIAEVLNPKNVPHFERANVNDFIISNEMSSKIMVRSALYTNVSDTLKELLTSKYGNEIYESKVSLKYVGKSFKDVVCEYIDQHNAIILAVANDGVIVNPDKDYIIKKNDIFIYISKNKFEE